MVQVITRMLRAVGGVLVSGYGLAAVLTIQIVLALFLIFFPGGLP